MKPPSLKSPPKLPQLQYSLIDSNPDANMQKPEPNMIGELLEVKIESPEEIKTKTSDPKHKYIEYGVRQTWWPQDRFSASKLKNKFKNLTISDHGHRLGFQKDLTTHADGLLRIMYASLHF
eukprot:m.167828 g.167828  ORF g.167828 m.167828 type:complete len:121 (-) comp15308_c0_seq21:2543-2905(-)